MIHSCLVCAMWDVECVTCDVSCLVCDASSVMCVCGCARMCIDVRGCGMFAASCAMSDAWMCGRMDVQIDVWMCGAL